jgi:hypothetical protein
MVHASSHDATIDAISDALNNFDMAPISASGNSFSGIMQKLTHLSGIVGQWASRAAKVTKILQDI